MPLKFCIDAKPGICAIKLNTADKYTEFRITILNFDCGMVKKDKVDNVTYETQCLNL